jgi:tetratricopeptide (TPR) repeat protein
MTIAGVTSFHPHDSKVRSGIGDKEIMIPKNVLCIRVIVLMAFQVIGIAICPAAILAQHCEPYWTAEYKCLEGCGPCGGGSGNSNSGSRTESARSQRIDAANALYDRGWAAFQRGEWAAALELFEQAEAEFSYKGYRRGIAMANMELEWAKGHAARERGDFEAELAYFQKSLAFYPTEQGRKNIATAQQDIANAKNRLQQQQADAQKKLEQQQAAERERQAATTEIKQVTQRLADTLTAVPSPDGLDFGDPMVVNAQNVPSGLPKSVDDAVSSGYTSAPPGVSDRVRKGFQAIATHDWKLAKAWFGDALNHDPNNAGLKRLVELADYTEKRVQQNKTAELTNRSSPQSQVQLPEDSDMELLFPGWKPAASPISADKLPKDSDIEFLFPGLPAIQAKEMNDYIFNEALKDADNDPVLKKLSNRPNQK